MKKILKIGSMIIGFLLIYYIIIFALNQILIANYNKQIYKNDLLIGTLHGLTINSSYIVYYNQGNLLYQEKKYAKAIEKYDKALKRRPPQKRVCDIRINKSLAKLALIDETNKDKALEQLREARYNLYENGCVDRNYYESYSLEAEQLEQEIKELEEKLEKNDNNNQQVDNNQDNESNSEEDKYSQIEEQLRQNERDAQKNRQEELEQANNLDNYDYYNYYEKNW